MIVVSDTSPLLHLARVDGLALLRGLAAQVHLPRTVLTELFDGRTPAPALERLRAVTWLRVDADAEASPTFVHLLDEVAPGSAAAITMAELRGAALLLVDDPAARRVALGRGLRVLGTDELLLEAKHTGRLDSAGRILRAPSRPAPLTEGPGPPEFASFQASSRPPSRGWTRRG